MVTSEQPAEGKAAKNTSEDGQKEGVAKKARKKLLAWTGAGVAAVLALALATLGATSLNKDRLLSVTSEPLQIVAAEGPPSGVDFAVMSQSEYESDIVRQFPGGKTRDSQAASVVIYHPYRMAEVAVNLSFTNVVAGDIRIKNIRVVPKQSSERPRDVLVMLDEQGGGGQIEGTTYLTANLDKPLSGVHGVDSDGKPEKSLFFSHKSILLQSDQSDDVTLTVGATQAAGTFGVAVDYALDGKQRTALPPDIFNVAGPRCSSGGDLSYKRIFRVVTGADADGALYSLQKVAGLTVNQLRKDYDLDLSRHGC